MSSTNSFGKKEVYFVFVLVFFSSLMLSSCWSRRGHRCRPFSPPPPARYVRQFLSRRGFVQHSQHSSIFTRFFANYCSRAFRESIFLNKKNSKQKEENFECEYSLGVTGSSEIDLRSYGVNPVDRRGRWECGYGALRKI